MTREEVIEALQRTKQGLLRVTDACLEADVTDAEWVRLEATMELAYHAIDRTQQLLKLRAEQAHQAELRLHAAAPDSPQNEG